MAVFKSVQLTNIEAVPAVQNPARDADARRRAMVYEIGDITGLIADDTIRLGTLRKGWRLLGFNIVIPANKLAATATVDLGVTGTEAKYLAAGVVGAAAVELEAGHTAALNFGEVLAADIELVMKVETAGAGSAPTATAFVVARYTRD
jgi:hypothetical protein